MFSLLSHKKRKTVKYSTEGKKVMSRGDICFYLLIYFKRREGKHGRKQQDALRAGG